MRKWFILLLLLIIVVYVFHPILMKKIFPVKYQEEIIYSSKEFEVDPFLVAAIIRVESNFDSYALSPKGAMGLMQIMPATANWAAGELRYDGFYIEKLYIPDVNIELGSWYVQNLDKQFDGNIRVVLAAYNGGSGNVSKWLLDKRYSADGKELEYIPFPETRRYVEKVLFYFDLYKKIYNF